MRSRPDVLASDAIEDVWLNSDRYAFECYSSVAFIQYKAMLARIGPALFNQRYRSGVSLYFSYHEGPRPTREDFERYGLQRVDVGGVDRYEELIPGDQTTFHCPTPAAEGGCFNENTIYLGEHGGRRRFFAHPLGIIQSPSELSAYYADAANLVLSRHRYRWRF
jgi:protein-glutamine gamma-glutamyltransferase